MALVLLQDPDSSILNIGQDSPLGQTVAYTYERALEALERSLPESEL